MISTGPAARLKVAPLIVLLPYLLLTGCGREQLSLPVAQAATTHAPDPEESASAEAPPLSPTREESSIAAARAAEAQLEAELSAPEAAGRDQSADNLHRTLPGQSCYASVLHQSRAQRDEAVQARLQQADRMSAALDSETFNVELVGDHANVLSLEFPTRWPASPAYAASVSAVIIEYLSAPRIQSSLCNSGFSEVKLAAQGLDDGRTHEVWSAKVTSEGLMREEGHSKRKSLIRLTSAE
jgi:hypothetical protein